ncbi:MAG: hypothetical protein V3V02_01605 [Rhizobiaceae bacterium]
MDKPISEWTKRFRGMPADQITESWKAKAADKLSWTLLANFHVAAAERMKQLGHMAIDLDEDTRLKLCREANSILSQLQRHLVDRPEQLAEIDEVVKKSDAYFDKYGSRTARYYMYEQGVINDLGDRRDFG